MNSFRSIIKFAAKLIVILALIVSLTDLYFRIFPSQNFLVSKTINDRDELFDSDLQRYNSLKKLEARVDSDYFAMQGTTMQPGDSLYPSVLSALVRRRFYHGYAAYSMGNNFLAMLAGKSTGRTYDAVVKGDEILEFEEADCRQQCLVMMEILMNKGYPVRGIHMDTRKYDRAHYTFETFYHGAWHFYDPDLEPDADMLLEQNRPSVAKLLNDTLLLTTVYRKQDANMIVSLFKSYRNDKENVLIPRHLYIFHSVTKFLSNWTWLICLIILFYPKWSIVFNKQRVPVNPMRREQTLATSPKFSSPA